MGLGYQGSAPLAGAGPLQLILVGLIPCRFSPCSWRKAKGSVKVRRCQWRPPSIGGFTTRKAFLLCGPTMVPNDPHPLEGPQRPGTPSGGSSRGQTKAGTHEEVSAGEAHDPEGGPSSLRRPSSASPPIPSRQGLLPLSIGAPQTVRNTQEAHMREPFPI